MKAADVQLHRSSSLAPVKRAYSLVELVVSMFTVSVLSVGLSSAIYLTNQVFNASNQSREDFAVTTALTSLGADLRDAKAVSQYTANQITATVPDRTGDGVDDQIQYTWSGTAGSPIHRQINSGPTQIVVPAARAIDLDMRIDTIPVTSTTSMTSSTVHEQSANSSKSDREITATTYFGQYIYPSLPPQTISWRPTQINIQIRKSNASTTGTIYMTVSSATPNGWPTGTLLATAAIDVALWSSTNYATRSIPVTVTNSLAPTQGITIVFTKGTVPSNRQILLQSTSAIGASGMMTSTGIANMWTQSYSDELIHSVVADCEVPSTTVNNRTLRWLRWQVQTDASSSLTKPLSVEFLNRIAVP